jgi:hydrophobic/amphiphilic exporter-1 (mainly G- bacteria), HAE1 family
MKLTSRSVARPVFTTMVVLIVVLLGVVSLSRLPIDLMPELQYPTLTVNTNYENASPEEMEELITRRIEEAVAAVPGVEEITSTSSEGVSSVRVAFNWGTDLDAAANDVRDRLDRVAGNLPDDADRPQLRRFDAAAMPILFLGASSRLDPIDLRQFMDDVVKQRLERIPGVAAVDIWGGLQREIQINLDPDRIIAFGLPLDSILQSIREANVAVPAGTIERDHRDITLRTPGQITDLDELRGIVVAVNDGVPVFLEQVAEIDDSHQRITRLVRIDGEPGIRLAVRKQSGTNTVDVAQRVLAEIDRINETVSQVELIPLLDTSAFIQQSINNVSRSVLAGGSLAVLVLLFFLRNIRSTLVVATAIPISIIATFSLIYFSGFTLNLMTLGGLALGVGMMVDSAIVVLENITRHREQGDSGVEAAVVGTEQVTPAIVAGTLTTLVIFIPLLFMEGMAGVMFQQLGYVVGFALICSLAVAVTLIPMLAARLLRPPGQHGPAWIRAAFGLSRRMFERLEAVYFALLTGALRWRFTVLAVVGALLAGSLWVAALLGSDFMPQTDEGEVRVTAEMEVGTRLDVLDEQVQKIEQIVRRAVPEIQNSVVSVGASGWRASAITGEVRLALLPAAQRSRSSEEIATALRRELNAIPGTTVRVRAGGGFNPLSRLMPDAEGVQVEIRGFDLQTLDVLARHVESRIQDVPGITDVRVSREAGAPQELVRIDRDRAADLGLSVSRVARAMQTAIAGSRAGEFRDGGQEHRIIVRMRDAERLDPEEILNFTVTNNRGEAVALRNVVELVADRGPVQIDRKNQQRIAQVSANISGRDLVSVVRDVRERLGDIPVPRAYEIVIAGEYEEQQEAFHELLLSLALAILLVYMVMACLYESLRDPLIVMFSVPLALIGVVAILLLTDTPFSVPAYIGGIMLAGIVVNNAILIVDQAARIQREENVDSYPAVIEAGRRRLRPILMTSMTTALGLTPLALGIGEGAEAQAPMARVVIGGIFSASLITLIVIPIIYCLFHPGRRTRTVAERTPPVAPAHGAT